MAYEQEVIKPYNNEEEKGEQVEQMFDQIAHSYDLLNHTLSLGIDKGWRRKAIDKLGQYMPQKILDIATGTGDFAILAAERIKPIQIIGVDISVGMMNVGREKVEKKGMQQTIQFQKEDCMRLSFHESEFDAVMSAYGVRNFQDLDAGLREMYRVLKTGGHALIVELATPPHFPMKQLFWLYAHVVMPVIGRIVSRDAKAYTYLPTTMAAFPQGEEMEKILKKAGFSNIFWKRFTFGICTMYLAEK